MSRYFDVNVDELYKNNTVKAPGVEEKALSSKKLRIKKRRQVRLEKHHLKKTLDAANSSIKKLKEQDKPLIDEKRKQYYSRGEGLNDIGNIKTKFHKRKLIEKEKKIEWATEQSARAELLLTEEAGFLIPDDGERTSGIKQTQIAKSVDMMSAAKHFNLNLDFGPYRMNFTRNGRHLLIGGRKGHVACFDWVTKFLNCEINVMEEVFDVQWLHVETLFAVAQKNWVYIYDNKGVEIHCVKGIYKPLRLEFLPYHFLLSSGSEEGYLTWLDVSLGTIVSQFNTKLGRLSVMTQNPYNGVICTGHSKGIVSMWAPNSKEPIAKMLCHKTALSGVAVDSKGLYMATAAVDHTMSIWDVRNLRGPIQKYFLHSTATNLTFSQKSYLALSLGNVVEIYNDCCTTTAQYPYLRHRLFRSVGNIQFCPYEDVLGIAHQDGYTSVLIPGSGEPNIDALEANPFQTKKQRQEAEVKSLLEKIQPEMITLDPFDIAEVHVPTLKDKIEARNKLIHLKPSKIDLIPRKKKRKINAARVKEILQEEHKKEFIKMKNSALTEKSLGKTKKNTNEDTLEEPSVLDRFKSKKKH